MDVSWKIYPSTTACWQGEGKLSMNFVRNNFVRIGASSKACAGDARMIDMRGQDWCKEGMSDATYATYAMFDTSK